MNGVTPEQIAGVVAGLMVLAIWIRGLGDARRWNRSQKDLRENRERRERGEPPAPSTDDPDHPRGPWA